MAIAVDNKTSSETTAAGTSLTFSHTCTGSDLILFVIAATSNTNSSPNGITSATYNGVAMTKSAGNWGPSNGSAAVFYLINPATGAHNVVVNRSGFGTQTFGATAISYTGVAQASPIDGSVDSRTGVSSGDSGSVTTTQTADWGIMYVIDRTSGSPSASTNSTDVGQVSTNLNGTRIFDSRGVTGGFPTGTANMSFTLTGSHTWALIMTCFKDANPPVNNGNFLMFI